jgi:hypothetical protein
VSESDVTLPGTARPAAGPAESVRERVTFDDDDLLADVDGGVNENEFKW